ncbi:ubiquitin-like-conjugating enzyme ATG10 isoform X1 [Saccostrea echinata]|uniref:ubiquitin-like-conjugating enzyme ATG10 isoform X1 n=1 Tax=Saccostrea echinata TaxID=191078 RepID=UPI002A82076C|nr:ubiquitin-like-conjugating enzyme ATG10 isoform X1 [Saccostrea echinata]
MAAGSISEDEFWDSVIYFLTLSDKLDRKWTVKEAKDGGKYVMKKEEELSCINKDSTLGADFYKDQEIEEEDSSTLQTDGKLEQIVLTYEFHIVYSQSYNVPVLYFNAHFQNGKLLSLEEIWDMVPAVYKERLTQDRWTFISQQEHPLLGRPFYFLHPCHTADLMRNIPALTDKRQYIIAWLSAVGPVVGLQLPLEYGQHP